jgi:uncharacterized protein YegL
MSKKLNMPKPGRKRLANLIIVDASGSMSTKVSDVRGGLKRLFDGIKEDAKKFPEAVVTTIVMDFSSAGDFRVLVNSTDPSLLTDELANSYDTRSSTALYDAIGRGFLLVPTDCDGVFVNILTDGQENDSKEYRPETIKAKIEEMRSRGWAITFMGTSEAELATARSLGFSATNTVMYANSGAGTLEAFETSNNARMSYMSRTMSGESFNADTLMTDVHGSSGNMVIDGSSPLIVNSGTTITNATGTTVVTTATTGDDDAGQPTQ